MNAGGPHAADSEQYKEGRSVANDAHVKELKLGVDHWNSWRRGHFAEQPDLSGTDLNGINLVGANLIGANLSKANLSCANLKSAFLSCANLSHAYLSEANLVKANLSKADLTKADLSFADLSRATLIETDLNRATLIEAILTGANLSFADLNRANLTKANLENANLTKAILIEAILDYANLRACNLNQAIASEASLREANLIEARLNKADFSFALLIEANLRRANLSKGIFIEANFRGANLKETTLRKARFGRANLGSADLTEADASEANLVGVDLIRATLNQTIFVQAILKDSKLSGATLNKAILTNADLSEVDLSETDLTKTDLRQANLSQTNLTRSKIFATNFTGATLTGFCLEDAQLSSTTKLDGVTCDYVYLKRNNQDRRPNSGEFLPGEFAQLFHSALETINLTLHAGVNWTAFAHSINRLNAEYKTAQLGIQSIENKGDGIIVLKLSTSPGSDTVQIHRDFMRIYEETKQTLENRRQLNARDTLLAHTSADSTHPRESINQLFELLNPSLGINASRSAPLLNRLEPSAVPGLEASGTATATDTATILTIMLNDLAQRYPDATHSQRLSVTALEIQQKTRHDIRFKAKLHEAVQSSSLLINQVLLNNPFVSVNFEMVREWLDIDVRSLTMPIS
jgi:uncharacterized protein YjbI with pentapeptide repeats